MRFINSGKGYNRIIHLTTDQKVRGSTPFGITMKIKGLQDVGPFLLILIRAFLYIK
jgi:hypothetical protein